MAVTSTTELAAVSRRRRADPRRRPSRRHFRFVANRKAATGLVILGVLHAPRDHRPVDRAVRPVRPRPRPAAGAVGQALVRHHPPRPGHLQPGAGRHPQRDVRRLPRRRRSRRSCPSLIGVTAGYLGGAADEALSALSNVFLVIPALPLIIIITSSLPNAGDMTGRAGHRLHVVGLGRPGAARADAVAAPARLRRGGPGHRRDDLAHHRCFEILPNLTAIIAVRLRRHRHLRGHVRDHARLHRRLRHRRLELGHDPVLGAEPAGAAPRAPGGGSCRPVSPSPSSAPRSSLLNFGIDEFVNPRLRDSGGHRIKTRTGYKPGCGSASPRCVRDDDDGQAEHPVGPVGSRPSTSRRTAANGEQHDRGAAAGAGDPQPRRRLRLRRRVGARGPRRQPDAAPRRGARPGRRERQRQVDAGLRPDPAAAAARRGRAAARSSTTRPTATRTTCCRLDDRELRRVPLGARRRSCSRAR